MSEILEQFLIAATIVAFFKLKAGAAAWQKANTFQSARFSHVMSNGGRPMAEAIWRAEAVYGQAW